MSKRTYFQEFFNFIIQKKIVIPSLFILLILSMPTYSDPMFYFTTNKLNFTPTQIGTISVFAYLGSICAIISYRFYFKNYSFKSMMIGGDILYFIFSFFTFCLVMRYNLLFGIPDFLFVSVSLSVLSLLGELMVMPILSLACTACPKNLEASVYAYFISVCNTAATISGFSGAGLTTLLGIGANDFVNLPYLVMISNLSYLLPLIWLIY